MIKLPSIIKTPKHRTFSFKTRYYNAEKEAFDERVRKAMAEAGSGSKDVEEIKSRIHDQFANKRKNSKTKPSSSQNLRIVIIIAILSALFYWILR